MRSVGPLTYAVRLAALLVVYVVAGKLGLLLAFLHASATPVWPPTGIALAALLVLGYRVWPAILVAAFLVNVTTQGSVASSLGIAVGNTLEGLLGAFLVNRFANGRRVFNRPRDTFTFAVLAAMLSTAVSATVGVTSLALGGYAAWNAYRAVWLTWWLGDAAGALIVTPVLVLWSAGRGLQWNGRRIGEAALLLVALVLVGEVVFGAMSPFGSDRYAISFLCVAPLLWAAFRFGPREAATAIVLLSGMAIWGTLHRLESIGGHAPNESLLLLEAFMAAMAMVAIPTAAVVADRNRAGEALRENEARLRQLADSVPVMVWMSGPDKLCTFFNRSWLDFTGRALEQELAYGWADSVHPEDLHRCLATYVVAFDAREPFEMQYRLRRADGVYRWVVDRGVPRHGAAGDFQGYTGGCVDINDRKRAEDRIRAQHATSRVLAGAGSLAEATPGILKALGEAIGWEFGAAWWVDRDASLIRCGELWHSPMVELPAFVAATRGQAFERGVGLPGRVWEGGRAAWIPDVVADGNFPRAPVAAREGLRGAFAFPVLLAGQCLGVVEFFTRTPEPPDEELLDVVASVGSQLGQFAERKRIEAAARQSEERTVAMVQTALDAIITINHRGRITEFNPAAEAMFGHRRQDVLGREMAELIIPGEEREAHRRGLARYLETGVTRLLGRRIEMTALRASGDRFPVELAITRMPTEGPPAFTGYVRDITDRRRAEEQREELLLRAHRARAEAEASSRLKDDFLATLSHELRTPLNAIVGWAHMLRSETLDPASAQRAIAVIDRNARAQAQIIEDLLDVSRIVTGQLRLEREPVDLGALVEQSLDVVRPAAGAKRIRLEAEIDPDLGTVLGDRNRLQQVVWNLLSNAVKFTPEDGRVDVQLARATGGATISVLDTGKGISPAFLPYIFDRFRQADSTTTRMHGGLGLGLAIVRHLVELHGGTVRAENRADQQGAAFTVTLPARGPVRLQEEPDGASPRSDEAVAPQLPRLDGVHALVVDDDPDALDLASAILTSRGAVVTGAQSAAEAMTAFSAARPDVIVCDIGMPGEDGYSLIRRIRAMPDERDARVPAVALTAYAQRDDRLRARRAGFDRYVAKPVDLVDLCVTAAALTGRGAA